MTQYIYHLQDFLLIRFLEMIRDLPSLSVKFTFNYGDNLIPENVHYISRTKKKKIEIETFPLSADIFFSIQSDILKVILSKSQF